MEQPKEKVEQEARTLARGRADDTPVRVHLWVTALVALLVGVVLAAAFLVWVLVGD